MRRLGGGRSRVAFVARRGARAGLRLLGGAAAGRKRREPRHLCVALGDPRLGVVARVRDQPRRRVHGVVQGRRLHRRQQPLRALRRRPPGSRPSTGIAPSCRVPRARCSCSARGTWCSRASSSGTPAPARSPWWCRSRWTAERALWSEHIVFRDNVLHDSYDNDILKINNGARFVRVEGNVFYNQTGSDEHIDVNSVTDVVIADNVFFNDFAGSGRANNNDTSSYIVIKDSNAADDGQVGSERITVRRNVFLNWEGGAGSNFVLVGEDGQPFHEARQVMVENNLMIGNSANEMRAAFGVKGARDITFRNNTVAGNLPACAYAMRLNQEGANPQNQDVSLLEQRLVAIHTGTMGAGCGGGNDFSDGAVTESTGVQLDRNLYWNGGAAIPPGDVLSPLVDDARRVVADAGPEHEPRRHRPAALDRHRVPERERDDPPGVRASGRRLRRAVWAPAPPSTRPISRAAPADDMRGRPRTAGTAPDLGAYETGVLAFAVTPTSGVAAGGTRLTLTGIGLRRRRFRHRGRRRGRRRFRRQRVVRAGHRSRARARAPVRRRADEPWRPDASRSRADIWRTSSTCPARTSTTGSWRSWCGAGSPAAAAAAFLPRRIRDPRADGGLPAHVQGAGGLPAAAVRDAALRRRALLQPVRALDQRAGGARDHRRLQRHRLLPVRRGLPRADVGLPALDLRGRRATRRPPARRRRSPTCPAAARSRAGSTSWSRGESPAAAAAGLFCPTSPVTRGQMSRVPHDDVRAVVPSGCRRSAACRIIIDPQPLVTAPASRS